MNWQVTTGSDDIFGVLMGTPLVEGEFPFLFTIERSRNNGVSWDPHTILMYNLKIQGETPIPMIVPPHLPDAMVGSPYNFTINTLYFDTQGKVITPTWVGVGTVQNPGVINQILEPAGLEMRTTAPFSSAVIYGTPTEDSLTGGNTPGSVLPNYGAKYSFEVRVEFAPEDLLLDIFRDFEITVWRQPTITLAPNLDGMEGQPYNLALTDAFIVNNADDLLAEYLDVWDWRWMGDDITEIGLDYYLVNPGYVDPGNPVNNIPPDLTKIAISGTPEASTAGDYEITLALQSTNRRLIQGEIKPVTFRIRIWPRPTIKDWDIHGGRLPDGMVGPGAKADQPPVVLLSEPDEIYSPARGAIKPFAGARVEAGIPDGLAVSQITWGLWSGTKASPVHSSLIEDVAEVSGLKYSTSLEEFSSIGQTLHITGKTTDDTEPGNHELKIGFQIEHANPNISGARVYETFDLRIWRRAYLSVDMRHTLIPTWDTGGHVRRSGVTGYREYNEVYTPTVRAVIPGQWGTIQSIQTGFIRWEVSRPVSIPREPLGSDGSLMNWPGIGGNWELSPPNTVQMGWVHIRMPMPTSLTAVLDPGAAPLNVAITGWHSEQPNIIAVWEPVEKDIFFTRPFVFDNDFPHVIGDGPLSSEVWSLSNLPGDTFPENVNITSSGIIRGTPREREPGEFPETFRFYADITLPGTMRLTYGSSGLVRNDTTTSSTPFSLFVDIFHPRAGDFNGDGSVDLTDLVLLSRWIHGNDLEKANAEAAMRFRDGWRNSIIPKNLTATFPANFPNGEDLTELARWFAHDGLYRSLTSPSD
jgi:hypothetical protein